jgi:hypothetical protein
MDPEGLQKPFAENMLEKLQDIVADLLELVSVLQV